MSRLSTVTLGAAVLAWASGALAQEFRVGAGAALPIEPSGFTDLYDIGFHGGVEILGPVNRSKTTHMGVALYHHRFLLDEQGAMDAAGAPPGTDLELSGGTYLITELFGQLRADFSSTPTRGYFIAGLGLAHQDSTDLSATVAGTTRTTSFDSETDPLLTLGVGLTHGLDGFALFAQVRVTTVFSDDEATRFVPITVGAQF